MLGHEDSPPDFQRSGIRCYKLSLEDSANLKKVVQHVRRDPTRFIAESCVVGPRNNDALSGLCVGTSRGSQGEVGSEVAERVLFPQRQRSGHDDWSSCGRLVMKF